MHFLISVQNQYRTLLVNKREYIISVKLLFMNDNLCKYNLINQVQWEHQLRAPSN